MAGSNSPFSSGSGVSSLLNSAQSVANQVQAFQDEQVANEWDNSAQTYSDFLAYSNYLDAQAKKTTDPTKQLTYTNKVETARRSYVSNEVQRLSQQVIEGSISNVDKYNEMVKLYYQANDNGDYNLAQNIHSQLDSLSVTIQNEQKAAATASSEARTQAAIDIDNTLQDYKQQIKDNVSATLQEYSSLGPDKFQQEYGSDIFSVLYNAINSQNPDNPGLVQLYQAAIANTPDAAKARSYQTDLNNIINGQAQFNLPGVGNIGLKDIEDQVYAQSIGESLYDTVETANGVQFKKNQVTGYQYGRDENGNYKLMPVYNSNSDFTSNVPGKKGNQSYQALLKNAGFDVLTSGNTLTVRNNGFLNQAGIPQGQEVQLYVDANGNLQVVNGNKQYNLNFDQKTGKYLGLQEQTPNPINLVPTGTQEFSRFNNRYFASQGQDFLDSLNAGTIATIDTTSPFARPIAPSTLISNGLATQLQTPAVVPLSAPKPIQGSTVKVQNANVNPAALPAKTKIVLPKPKPLPKVTVNNKPNTQKVKVNNSPPAATTLTVNNKPNTETIRI